MDLLLRKNTPLKHVTWCQNRAIINITVLVLLILTHAIYKRGYTSSNEDLKLELVDMHLFQQRLLEAKIIKDKVWPYL